MDTRIGLFVPTGKYRWSGSNWYYQILDLDDEKVTVRLYDDAYSTPIYLSYRDFDELIIKYGLWEKTGIYQSDKYDNPAISSIKLATRNPQYAGEEIYRLEKLLKNNESFIFNELKKLSKDTKTILLTWLKEDLGSTKEDDPSVGIFRNEELVEAFEILISSVEEVMED